MQWPSATSTMRSATRSRSSRGIDCVSRRLLCTSSGSEPALTPMRKGTSRSRAAVTTRSTFSRSGMLPGLRRRAWTPASRASSASGTKREEFTSHEVPDALRRALARIYASLPVLFSSSAQACAPNFPLHFW